MIAGQARSDGLSNALKAIDKVVQRINDFKVEPQFSKEVKRCETVPDFRLKDEEILRLLISLIAYSNNANAERVSRLVDGDVFKPIFQNYSIEKTAGLSADKLIRDYWGQVKDIRFKYKIDAMIRCARGLILIRERHGSFMVYINGVGLPCILESVSDIQSFWHGFEQIRDYFRQLSFPYFGNFTTLCHLLKDLGFDCAKPDIAVMRAAVNLGIVPPPPKQIRDPEKSRPHPEENLKKTVKTMQAYALHRNLRTAVIDLYFLIHGRQSDAIRLVRAGYYS